MWVEPSTAVCGGRGGWPQLSLEFFLAGGRNQVRAHGDGGAPAGAVVEPEGPGRPLGGAVSEERQ